MSNDGPANGGPAIAARGRQPRIPGAEAGAGRVDVLILGAGAAGLACACEASRRGLGVLLLERGRSPGRKLSACGGGRANFSNRSVTPEDYLCRSDAAFCPMPWPPFRRNACCAESRAGACLWKSATMGGFS